VIRFPAEQFRTQWEVFDVQDDFARQYNINLNLVTFSEDMMGVTLGFKEWSGIQYTDDLGDVRIGYGFGDPSIEQGMTEAEAYAELVEEYRQAQRIVKAQIPLVALPQTVFDALTSLYADTGTWRVVQADEGTYDMAFAVKNANWLLAADILMRGNVNPDLRKSEARVLYLGEYFWTKDRAKLTTDGIQRVRKSYVSGGLDPFQRRQAEFVYYRQLRAFLPTMSEAKQRRVVAEAVTAPRASWPSRASTTL